MLRFWCAATSLWLLLALGGYRHEILAPGPGFRDAAAAVCEMPVSVRDARPAPAAPACRERAPAAGASPAAPSRLSLRPSRAIRRGPVPAASLRSRAAA